MSAAGDMIDGGTVDRRFSARLSAHTTPLCQVSKFYEPLPCFTAGALEAGGGSWRSAVGDHGFSVSPARSSSHPRASSCVMLEVLANPQVVPSPMDMVINGTLAPKRTAADRPIPPQRLIATR